nr:hypothetical protein Iba_chr05dCG9840 [Ipomoea batatas]
MRTGKSIRLHLLELFGSLAADPLLQRVTKEYSGNKAKGKRHKALSMSTPIPICLGGRDEIELKMAFGSCETASRNVFCNTSLDTAKSMEKFYDLQLRSEISSYPFRWRAIVFEGSKFQHEDPLDCSELLVSNEREDRKMGKKIRET